MAKRVAGICYIKVDGEQLEVSGGIEVPLLEVKREAVMGLAGPAGMKETALEPYVKLSAIFMPDFPLDKLQTNTDMTITAELANGKVYTLSGAFLAGESSAKGEDGTTELQFSGKRGQWQ
ncbi:MAG: phage tail tube protein [Aquabacterium sp.]|nr:phage tail tube protein [Aquabacterium sp.]